MKLQVLDNAIYFLLFGFFTLLAIGAANGWLFLAYATTLLIWFRLVSKPDRDRQSLQDNFKPIFLFSFFGLIALLGENGWLWFAFELGLLGYGEMRITNAAKGHLISNQTVPRVQPAAPSLATHKTASSQRRSSKPSKEMQWQGRTTLEVGNWKISDPMTYVGKKISEYGEASCIDIALPVGNNASSETEDLGYWPSYSQMSRAQRAVYLNWLAGGRQDTDIDIGYGFVYFYGLERRILVDGEDVDWCLQEVVRLMNLFSHSRSFTGYSQRLLAYVLAKVGPAALTEVEFGKDVKWLDHSLLAVVLAALAEQDRPLSPALAFQVARLDGRTKQSVVLKRTPEEFFEYFELHYRKLFGGGMQLKASKRKERIGYHPASPSLSAYQLYYTQQDLSFADHEVPSVLALSSQFKPLAEIWNQGIDALKSYSRELGKQEVDDRAAFEALPPELRSQSEHPDLESWTSLLDPMEPDQQGMYLLQAGDIALLQGIKEKEKLTLKESKDLAQTAEVLGFCLEPDARFHGQAHPWKAAVALYKNPQKEAAEPADAYDAARLILELGVVIAAADGKIESVELEHTSRFIEGNFLLSGPDSLRLEAFSKTLQSQPPTILKVANRLQKSIEPNQLATVARFAVGVAAANGEIDPGELTALSKMFNKLDIPLEELDTLIEQEAEQDDQLVVVREATGKKPKGEPIPQKHNQAKPIRLDPNKIRQIMQDTQKVSTILHDQFNDEALEELLENQQEPVASLSSIELFEGLDAMYHQCLSRLVEQESWSPSEFDQLVREHKLMPAGMLDAVNEWSDEALGDFLIEEGGSLTINLNLLEERK